MSNKKLLAICPVCGYDKLEEPPYDEYGNPSFEICYCCGYEFGYTDTHDKKSFAEYLCEWISSGFEFFYKPLKPEKWDAEVLREQLKNICKVDYKPQL